MGTCANCFVCLSNLSKSNLFSSNGYIGIEDSVRRAKRRKNEDNLTNLTPTGEQSCWKVFLRYFYPPPLVPLLCEGNNNNNNSKRKANLQQIPKFCPACLSTLSQLSTLHEQLELIQSQIKRIVAQVSALFVEKENEAPQDPQEEDEHFLRECIRRRYLPQIICSKILPVKQESPMIGDNSLENSARATSLSLSKSDSDSVSNFLLSLPIKQEADESIDLNTLETEAERMANSSCNSNEEEVSNPHHESTLSNDQDYIDDDNYSDEKEDERDSQSDSDFEPEGICSNNNKMDNSSAIKLKANAKDKERFKNFWDIDLKVSDNTYKYAGVWPYQVSENMNFFCLTCNNFYGTRQSVVSHINYKHNNKKKEDDRDSQSDSDCEPEGMCSNNNKMDNSSAIKLKAKAKDKERFKYFWTIDLKVSDNTYKYRGVWPYQVSEDMNFFCLTCNNSYGTRQSVVSHINYMHINKKKEDERDSQSDSDCEPEGMCSNNNKMDSSSFIKNFWTIDQKVSDDTYKYRGVWPYQVSEDKNFICLTCNTSLGTRNTVVGHINKKHNNKNRVSCSDCGKSYKNQESFDAHKSKCLKTLVNHKSNRRCVRIDEKTFMYDGKYNIEKVQESNGIFYKCEECGQLKKTLEFLKKHIRLVHIDRHRFICDMCGWTGSTKQRLDDHQTSHSDVRNFICEVCGKAEKTKHQMWLHKQCHSEERFECNICHHSFKHKKHLQHHRRRLNHFPDPVDPTVHEEEVQIPMACEKCKKKYVDKKSYDKHIAECKGRIRERCDRCGLDVFLLKRHQKRNTNCRRQPNPDKEDETVEERWWSEDDDDDDDGGKKQEDGEEMPQDELPESSLTW